MKLFVWAVIIVVAASIVAGFFIVGSPYTERMRRFDDERVADLQNIQWQIVNFWQQKERFPKDLNELRDDVSGWIAPLDPETSEPYKYMPGEGFSFSLCAKFLLPSEAGALYPAPDFYIESGNWTHEAGERCFERIIDPERYPPFAKPAKSAR